MVNILKNKVVIYLLSRYIVYFFQFVTSILVAAHLDPYYLGVWGFIMLLLNYFQQFHFGIANSFNVLYVLHRNDRQQCNNYIGNSMVLISYLSGFVILFFLYYKLFGISIIDKYHVDSYIVWVCLIVIMQYFVMFFLNLFRVKNQLNRVTFCQSIIVFFNFACVFFFNGEELIQWLVFGYVIGNLMCIMMAFTSGSIPKWNNMTISKKYQQILLKKGLFLFLYNSCFYFIIISIRTVISDNYSIEEFGLFTFSYTLANALMLVLDALMFIVFPKVIGKLSSEDTNEVESTINLLRNSYIPSAHMLVYIAIVFFPIVLLFLPQYSGARMSMNLIALSIIVNANSCGYLELLISRNKEKIAAFLSASALIMNILFALLFVKVWQVPFSYVIISTLVTYLFFSLAAMFCGRNVLGKFSCKSFISQYFPIRLLIPYLSALILSVFDYDELLFIPLLLFVVLNISFFRQMINIVKSLLIKPETISL